MKEFAKVLLAGAVAVIATSSASASIRGSANWLTSVQNNLNTVYSDMHLYGDWLGSLRATSAAIGNNASMNTVGTVFIYNNQLQMADVGATLRGFVSNVHGNASLQAVGICNNFAATNKKSEAGLLINFQRCATLDPFAITEVGLANVGGDATVSAVAISNNATFSTEALRVDTDNLQVNVAATYARVNTTLDNVAGDVTVTAAAIGNNLAIDQVLP